ncbi:hypothetical protein [Streptomyces jumonjinensis]|uniref:hypothetical protein n=1 Tax=Streptomyces jumonjinensis TaxID=1945 RepID=UPI001E4EF224|nr:hypothetical protein [Streptomyces jumonjinensis]
MTREGLAAMLGEQTTACGPARDALLSGGTFVLWDGLVPAGEVTRIYRARLRITQKRGQQTQALAATVNILDQAEEALLRIGRVDAADASWTFMLFLNATTTEVLACTGVAQAKPTTNPASSRSSIDPASGDTGATGPLNLR